MLFNTFVLFLSCLLLTGISKVVDAQALATFYSGIGPTIVAQDPSTGNFLYNLRSAKGFSSMQTINVKTTPKNGTAIASTGYSGSSSIYGSIFYQNTNNDLAMLIFKCAYQSGNCVNYGEYNISVNVTIPVNPKTRLSAALLSTNLGYRVTYEDIHGSVRQISYANSTKGVVTPWADGNLTGNFTVTDGYALATTYAVKTNVTAASETVYQIFNGKIQPLNSIVDNQSNSILDKETWVSTPAIGNLPSWNATNATFATLLYAGWNCIFYIDMNRQLQYVRSTDGGQTWSPQPRMDATVWPLADQPNAPLAAATSVNASDNSASIYYTSGRKLVQATITNTTWLPFSLVEAPAAKSNTTALTTATPHAGSTSNIKIGAAVGASFVVSVAIVAILVWRFHRKKRVVAATEKPDSIYELRGKESSSSEYTGKPELHGEPANITELDHDPECLLLHQLQQIRHYELRAGIPVELQNSEARRPELDGALCRCELDASVRYELPTCSETEDGVAVSPTSTKESCESSRKGKEKEVVAPAKELPSWSWENLRRETEEQEGKTYEKKEEEVAI